MGDILGIVCFCLYKQVRLPCFAPMHTTGGLADWLWSALCHRDSTLADSLWTCMLVLQQHKYASHADHSTAVPARFSRMAGTPALQPRYASSFCRDISPHAAPYTTFWAHDKLESAPLCPTFVCRHALSMQSTAIIFCCSEIRGAGHIHSDAECKLGNRLWNRRRLQNPCNQG